MTTVLPNPFESVVDPPTDEPAAASTDRPPQDAVAGSPLRVRLPGLQISLAGHQLDVVTFMAELGVVDVEFLRGAA
jgi:hypothetical protein